MLQIEIKTQTGDRVEISKTISGFYANMHFNPGCTAGYLRGEGNFFTLFEASSAAMLWAVEQQESWEKE